MKALTHDEFVIKSINVHKDRYDYSQVNYINTRTKVDIICKSHGVFKQLPADHYGGYGCPQCSNNLRYNQETFIQKAKEIHGDKYNYDLVKFVKYISPGVDIKCNQCKMIFNITPKRHINSKNGCPKCFGTRKHTHEEYIDKCNNKHNFKYSYISEYQGLYKDIEILCNTCGNIFIYTAKAHLHSGYGCTHCKISKGEEKILKYLQSHDIAYIREYCFNDCVNQKKLPFDFYLPDHNTCIEYDGEQHYKPIKHFGGIEKYKEIRIRDKIKTDYCVNNNIKLIRIPYIFQEYIDDILNYQKLKENNEIVNT